MSSAASSTLQIQTARVFVPLLEPARYKGAFGGRGSGKSHFFAELAVERCVMQPGTRIVCVREVQKSLKESVKRLIEDKIAALGVGRQFDILNDHIKTPGGGIILFQGMQDHTAESIKSLEGFNVAYVEEAQTLTKRSLEFLRPTIRADGSEIWFSWNPRSKRDPVDAFLRGQDCPEDAQVVRANWSDNPFFPAELEKERLHDKATSPDRYDHIWEGDYEPAAIGAYYAKEMAAADREGRICRVPHQPGTPVEVWFDLGARKQGRTMAVGFVQRVGLEVHCIDFMDDSGPERGMPWVVGELQRRQIERGYVYGDIVFPHDGGALQKATGETLAYTFEKAFQKAPIVLARDDIGPGIDEVRNTLPSMWFDSVRCDKWIEALRAYRAEYDDDKQTFKPHPVADWSAHAADMTRYGCLHKPSPYYDDDYDDLHDDRSEIGGY